MKTILTKYLPPTNTKGARIKAYADGASVVVSYDYSKSSEAAHTVAAQALCDKMGWTGEMVAGGLPDQTGYAFVFTGK